MNDDFDLWETELAACSHGRSSYSQGSRSFCGDCDKYIGPNRSHQ